MAQPNNPRDGIDAPEIRLWRDFVRIRIEQQNERSFGPPPNLQELTQIANLNSEQLAQLRFVPHLTVSESIQRAINPNPGKCQLI
jgi:hypothetical protein